MDVDAVAYFRDAAIIYLVLLSSICVHEFAHAWAADKLGDGTPRSQGRVTLDPRAHIDMLGTVILPGTFLVLPYFAGAQTPGWIFGWGLPVMVNITHFRRRTRDHLLTVGAGPFSNIVLCLIAAVGGALLLKLLGLFMPMEQLQPVEELIVWVIWLNAILAVFNMLPIPPLDGSWFLKYLTGMSDQTFMRLSQYSMFIFVGLILLSTMGIPILQFFIHAPAIFIMVVFESLFRLIL